MDPGPHLFGLRNCKRVAWYASANVIDYRVLCVRLLISAFIASATVAAQAGPECGHRRRWNGGQIDCSAWSRGSGLPKPHVPLSGTRSPFPQPRLKLWWRSPAVAGPRSRARFPRVAAPGADNRAISSSGESANSDSCQTRPPTHRVPWTGSTRTKTMLDEPTTSRRRDGWRAPLPTSITIPILQGPSGSPLLGFCTTHPVA